MFRVECLNKTGNLGSCKRNIEERWPNRFCRAKELTITCPQCVSISLLIQHAKRMRRIVLSTVTYLAVRIFPHYLINGRTFGRNFLNIQYILIEKHQLDAAR